MAISPQEKIHDLTGLINLLQCMHNLLVISASKKRPVFKGSEPNAKVEALISETKKFLEDPDLFLKEEFNRKAEELASRYNTIADQIYVKSYESVEFNENDVDKTFYIRRDIHALILSCETKIEIADFQNEFNALEALKAGDEAKVKF